MAAGGMVAPRVLAAVEVVAVPAGGRVMLTPQAEGVVRAVQVPAAQVRRNALPYLFLQ